MKNNQTLEGGEKTYDPSENVKALQEASNKRQDDLRKASDRLVSVQLLYVEKIAELRAEHQKELSAAAEKLSIAEAKRIDAIRAVDVNAVAVANEKQTAQAAVLATQVVQSAEALRNLVAATATTIAEQQRMASGQINERLTLLERSKYEIGGKAEGKSQGLSVIGQLFLGLLTAAAVVFAIMSYFK